MTVTYAEPPFERVWVVVGPARRPLVTFGLQFEGRTVEGDLHVQLRDEGLWAAGRRILLEDLAGIVSDEEQHHRWAMTGPR